ncbi:MAG: DUF4388 domain-containing protein [Pyrinomonadaceae bacterium]|nr:DUF4388 domain-containing protein [Pyrinomonadaceae bacterium]
MSDFTGIKQSIERDESVETTLVDADLYVKYQSPNKAFETLREGIKRHPHSVPLREKMREIGVVYQNSDEASEQCLALAGLYTATGDFDLAHDRLKEAKALDPRVSIAAGLEAIKKASSKTMDSGFSRVSGGSETEFAFAGDIALVSIFDAVEVIENSRMTGLFVLKSEDRIASIAFNQGKIVDAQANGVNDMDAFREIIGIETGRFEFSVTDEEFPEVISVNSNKNFLLNTLASLDAEKAEKMGTRDLSQEEIAL